MLEYIPSLGTLSTWGKVIWEQRDRASPPRQSHRLSDQGCFLLPLFPPHVFQQDRQKGSWGVTIRMLSVLATTYIAESSASLPYVLAVCACVWAPCSPTR